MLFNNRISSSIPSRDAALRTDEHLKVDLALLKEKVYAMRQEMQKMAAYESFLRFKKHQADEFFANWKRYLISKENHLKEKESWLEHKKNEIKNKEQELSEKEKKLNAISIEFQINGGCLAESTEGFNKNSNETANSLSDSKLSKYVSKFDGEKLAKSVEEVDVSQLIGEEKREGNLDKDMGDRDMVQWGEISAFTKKVESKRDFTNCNGLEGSLQNGYSEMNGDCFVGEEE